MHPSIHPSIRVILCMCVCSSMHTSIQICLCVYSDTHAKKNRSYEGAKRVLTPKEGSVSRMSETSAIMSAGSVRVWMRAHSYGNMWLCLYVCTCVWIWICILDTDIRTHTHRFFANTVGALVWNPMDVVKQKQQANAAVCAYAVLASFACVCARALARACVRVCVCACGACIWIQMDFAVRVCCVRGACCVCGPSS